MPRFTFETDFMGFDDADKVAPWQMIPEGQIRSVKLVEGSDDLEIRVQAASAPPAPPPNPVTPQGKEIVTSKAGVRYVSDVDPPAYTGLEKGTGRRLSPTERVVPLEGRRVGTYKVLAVEPKSGKTVAELVVEVLPITTLKIAYYLLPGAQKWDTRALNTAARKIVFDQAGVELVHLGVWGNENGDTVTFPPGDLDLNATATRAALLGYGNHANGGLMVYLTARSVSDANGMTLGNQCIIDSWKRKMDTEKDAMASTLAHEIMHRKAMSKGHDSGSKDNLMFDSSPHGIRMRKARILNVGRS